jgi:hypothetical protein
MFCLGQLWSREHFDFLTVHKLCFCWGWFDLSERWKHVHLPSCLIMTFNVDYSLSVILNNINILDSQLIQKFQIWTLKRI